MCNRTDTVIALFVGLVCMAPQTSHAQSEHNGTPNEAESIDRTEAAGVRAKDSILPDVRRTTRRAKVSTLVWGTGGLFFLGERSAAGSKQDRLSAPPHEWRRTVSAGVGSWQAVTADLVLSAGARIERANSGFVGGPLLSTQSQQWSKQAFVAVKAGNGLGLRLSAFDTGGWLPGNPYDLANRTANGESDPGKGTALELGMLGSAANPAETDAPRLSLRLDRANSQRMGADSRAQLTLRMSF